ncbi:hypothetical protein GGTG_09950 [Gaeumannomyces tritici R3-111a-1]|uniref:Autophagy-related protein 33 n=1 Tax=Gaeumannomyces tritici (strain R3-111a-1) TaxID=644352 RepID=J3P8W6_GAET3|nr:hypothetical protein GGTG_09950 [Gaeumannomyces tritici R3-111a-1]EJT73100.1 hypothetical protein GGTG_09950 [Gaeumannomyces tritici R3-111a-1]
MASRGVSLLKFVGTVSLGLLTGLSYTLSSLTAPALLTLPSASAASRGFGTLASTARTQLRALTLASSACFALAFLASPRHGRHPYLLYTSVLTGLSGAARRRRRRHHRRRLGHRRGQRRGGARRRRELYKEAGRARRRGRPRLPGRRPRHLGRRRRPPARLPLLGAYIESPLEVREILSRMVEYVVILHLLSHHQGLGHHHHSWGQCRYCYSCWIHSPPA